ncbi:MAG: hypothetical protein C4530_13125 [Desulfobacteraceae bacterium]|nr:MAG: hypothetical protein C4530_13125 [Desulfobacteraceae bacterium]
MAVPFFSIDFRWKEWQAFLAAVLTGHLREGNALAELEREVAKRFALHYVTFLPSARMGFDVLLEARFSKGDEIIIPAMGFPLYVSLMLQRGIKPVFVDVEPTHYTIDPERIAKAVTRRTRAILVTHLFGHPARMDEIEELSKRLSLPVIEDCAQSFDSFFRDRETGTFGMAGIFSCSVMKVPTTLGGGLFVTKDKGLHERIRTLLDEPGRDSGLLKTTRYFAFNVISILNSYPLIYSLLSHPALGLIKWRNPSLLRKILYSGLGLGGNYSRWERPRLANYQAAVGLRQFQRTSEMTASRIRYADILNGILKGTMGLKLPEKADDCRWNYQYYVIHAGKQADHLYHQMFARGIHVMKEDVWDCPRYPFAREYYRPCPVASEYTPGLIRIQNNSMMSEKRIRKIAGIIRQIIEEKDIRG